MSEEGGPKTRKGCELGGVAAEQRTHRRTRARPGPARLQTLLSWGTAPTWARVLATRAAKRPPMGRCWLRRDRPAAMLGPKTGTATLAGARLLGHAVPAPACSANRHGGVASAAPVRAPRIERPPSPPSLLSTTRATRRWHTHRLLPVSRVARYGEADGSTRAECHCDMALRHCRMGRASGHRGRKARPGSSQGRRS